MHRYMKKRTCLRLAFAGLFCLASPGFASCSTEGPLLSDTGTALPRPEENNPTNNETTMNRNIILSIGRQTFTATLDDNAAARAFSALLPLTLPMEELNGNEKYHYLSGNLPTQPQRPGTIQAGDLMLYGASCVVLFYQTFSSGYSYTRLGHIDHPAGLAEAVGRGDVSITFEAAAE